LFAKKIDFLSDFGVVFTFAILPFLCGFFQDFKIVVAKKLCKTKNKKNSKNL